MRPCRSGHLPWGRPTWRGVMLSAADGVEACTIRHGRSTPDHAYPSNHLRSAVAAPALLPTRSRGGRVGAAAFRGRLLGRRGHGVCTTLPLHAAPTRLQLQTLVSELLNASCILHPTRHRRRRFAAREAPPAGSCSATMLRQRARFTALDPNEPAHDAQVSLASTLPNRCHAARRLLEGSADAIDRALFSRNTAAPAR